MDDIEAFARANKRKVRVRVALLLAVFASPFAYLGWKTYSEQAARAERREAHRKELELSEAERALLRTSIAEARRRLAQAREGWTRAVTPEALAAVTPGGGPCGIRLTPPTAQAADIYARYGRIDGIYFGNISFRRHAAGKPIAPHEIDSELRQLDELAAKLEANTADRDDAGPLRGLEARSLFVVVDRETEPLLMPFGFTPGRVVGTAYVYSYREQRITCIGALDVENRESIEFDFSYWSESMVDQENKRREAAMATLRRDLDVRLQQALARSLRAAAASEP